MVWPVREQWERRSQEEWVPALRCRIYQFTALLSIVPLGIARDIDEYYAAHWIWRDLPTVADILPPLLLIP